MLMQLFRPAIMTVAVAHLFYKIFFARQASSVSLVAYIAAVIATTCVEANAPGTFVSQ